MFALFPEFGARTHPQDLWPFLISETGQKFLIWTQGEIRPGNLPSWITDWLNALTEWLTDLPTLLSLPAKINIGLCTMQTASLAP